MIFDEEPLSTVWVNLFVSIVSLKKDHEINVFLFSLTTYSPLQSNTFLCACYNMFHANPDDQVFDRQRQMIDAMLYIFIIQSSDILGIDNCYSLDINHLWFLEWIKIEDKELDLILVRSVCGFLTLRSCESF